MQSAGVNIIKVIENVFCVVECVEMYTYSTDFHTTIGR